MKKHTVFYKFILSLTIGMLPIFPSPTLSCDNEIYTLNFSFEQECDALDNLISALTSSKVILKDSDNHVQNVGILLNQYPDIVNKMFYAKYVSQFIHDSLEDILKEFGVALKSNSQWPYNNNVNFVVCNISKSVELLNKLLNNLIFQLELARQYLNIFDHYKQIVGNTFDEKKLIKELSDDDIVAKTICDKLTDIIEKYNLEKY